MNEHHRKDDEKIDTMYRVLFGDKATGEKGMIDKVDEIHTVFVKMSNGFSLLRWFFGAVIVLGLFIGTIKGWIVAAAHYLLSK